MSHPLPEVPPVPPEEPRRRPSTVGGMVYLLLVAIGLAGLALVAFGPWRRGVTLIGAGLIFSALMRALLRENDAGMLRVRSRWFDIAAMTGVGIAMIVLAAVIPNQQA